MELLGDILSKLPPSLVWWNTPVIPIFGRLRQEEDEFKVRLCYIERSYLKKKERKKESW
jgi:hypothetical protein